MTTSCKSSWLGARWWASRPWLRRLLLGAWLLAGVAGFAWGDGPGLTPQEGVVVLRNGYVLQGRITCLGDHYVVSVGEQGEVRLPVENVEMLCASLEEAYGRKRDTVRDGELQGHLDLAGWCLRHGLTSRAADQMLAAFALAPDDPRLRQLERRLALVAASFATADSEQQTAPRAELNDETVGEPAELPHGAVEFFTQKVQPTLLNRCASTACHGVLSAQQYQLIRPVRGGSLSHRMTQRNLRATLELIDSQQPDESPLLVAPRQVHGGLETPVLGELDRVPYQQLAVWVGLLTRKFAKPATGRQASWWTGAPAEDAAQDADQRSNFAGRESGTTEPGAWFGGSIDARGKDTPPGVPPARRRSAIHSTPKSSISDSSPPRPRDRERRPAYGQEN